LRRFFWASDARDKLLKTKTGKRHPGKRMNYIGRFAPTPTGPLHFGSLLAAVASYCDARSAGGEWRVRIEDLDPPRETPGAADIILQQLHAYGFRWDGDVVFQHQRHALYLSALKQLQQQGDIFWCNCSRTDLAKSSTRIYPGTCHAFKTPRHDAAIRLRVPAGIIYFNDAVFGAQKENTEEKAGDFVLRRRDGLFSYQLAVTTDDAAQGITHVVRGADLLDNTARQIILQKKLGFSPLQYLHIPLAVHGNGDKLSKQTFAAALPLPADPTLIWHALNVLGQHAPPSLQNQSCAEQLDWAVAHWQPEKIARHNTVWMLA
jgi:glutamyl-Q tRNA(Asp) synthetase